MNVFFGFAAYTHNQNTALKCGAFRGAMHLLIYDRMNKKHGRTSEFSGKYERVRPERSKNIDELRRSIPWRPTQLK